MIKIWKIQKVTIYWNLKNEKGHEKSKVYYDQR